MAVSEQSAQEFAKLRKLINEELDKAEQCAVLSALLSARSCTQKGSHLRQHETATLYAFAFGSRRANLPCFEKMVHELLHHGGLNQLTRMNGFILRVGWMCTGIRLVTGLKRIVSTDEPRSPFWKF